MWRHTPDSIVRNAPAPTDNDGGADTTGGDGKGGVFPSKVCDHQTVRLYLPTVVVLSQMMLLKTFNNSVTPLT